VSCKTHTKTKHREGSAKMNKQLLRSIMVLHNDTNKTLAEYLGISEKSVNDKINEKGTEFKQSEIAAIRKRYNLSDEQVSIIFFN
jgi:DNA-binding transcriptional regulator YiaG